MDNVQSPQNAPHKRILSTADWKSVEKRNNEGKAWLRECDEGQIKSIEGCAKAASKKQKDEKERRLSREGLGRWNGRREAQMFEAGIRC